MIVLLVFIFSQHPPLVKNDHSFYIDDAMPRVSQEHLDARRRQIIAAARRCFVRNGFHATSMQDVLAEAGLSAGAVYRYFPGKDDIIAAIADDALAEISQAVQRVLDTDPAPPLPEVVGRIVATMERLDVTQNITSVAVQVWAEALRSPGLAERVAITVKGIRHMLARAVEDYQARGLVASDVPAETIARLLTGLVPGFAVQRALLGDVDAREFADALRALLNGGSA
jgi:AcrR family transcriptional regulator